MQEVAAARQLFPDQMEKDLEDMLVIIPLILERPPRLENEPVLLGQDRELAVRVEFKRRIGVIDLTEEKKACSGDIWSEKEIGSGKETWI